MVRALRIHQLTRIHAVTLSIWHRSASTLPTTNPLLSHDLLPRFDEVKAEHVKPAIEFTLSKLDSNFTSLERKLDANRHSTSVASLTLSKDIEKIEALLDQLSRVWGTVGHLIGVAHSKELRDAYAAAMPSVVAMRTRLGQSKAVYALLRDCHVQYAGPAGAGLPQAQKRAVKQAVQTAELSGVALEGAARDRFNQILVQLSELSQKFDSNVIDSTAAYKLRLTAESDVEGLPPGLRDQFAAAARANGDASATAAAGPWLITLDAPSFRPFLQHARRRDLREQLYRAYVTRASSGDTDNGPVIGQILALRQEMAGILGFADYAQVSTASKMAGEPAAVTDLLKRLQAKAYPAAQKEFAELSAFARARGHPSSSSATNSYTGTGAAEAVAQHSVGNDGGLAHWDVPCWSERMREELYGIDEEEVRQYFPVPAVLSGLFALLEVMFGVQVKRVDGLPSTASANSSSVAPSAVTDECATVVPPVWHKDVGFYHIFEAAASDPSSSTARSGSSGSGSSSTSTRKRIASFYLDLYSRPGTKRGGAWADVCINRSTNPTALRWTWERCRRSRSQWYR